MVEYPISRYLPFSEKQIKEIDVTNLSDEEKLYVFLYYLFEKYGKSDINKLDEDENLTEILEFFTTKSYFKYLHKNIIEAKSQTFRAKSKQKWMQVEERLAVP